MASLQGTLKEVVSAVFWRDVLMEVVATMILLLAQCILPLSWGKDPPYGSLLQTAMGMCVVVATQIETFGPYSGAVMNPAVTLALVIARKISILKGVLYVAAQCVGAIAGAGIVRWVTPTEFTETLAATVVRPDVGPWKGLIVEMLITANLVFTVFGATNEKKKSVFMPSIPISFAVLLGVLIGSPYTGGSMNPARSLGPAVVMNIWEYHWVYWLGPCLGGTLASTFFNYVFNYTNPRNDEEPELEPVDALLDPNQNTEF